LMKRIGYPDYEVHQRGHIRIIRDIDSLLEKSRNMTECPQEVVSLFKKFIDHHNDRVDQNLAEFINRRDRVALAG